MASQVWPCKSTCGHSKLQQEAQFKRRQYFVPLWSLKDCIKPDYKIVTYDIEGVEMFSLCDMFAPELQNVSRLVFEHSVAKRRNGRRVPRRSAWFVPATNQP